jgi:acetyl esterase/lipase
VIPWLFLAVTIWGAAFTFNAYLPRLRSGMLIVPSFFAGWLTGELAAHHFAWQLAATVGFVWAGALSAWPGWLGLALTLASWVGLLAMVPLARRSEGAVDAALRQALGPGYREQAAAADRRRATAAPRGRLLVPLWLRDPAVRVVRDLRYAEGAGRRHLLDVYAPRQGARAAPVLLQIHGGAWTIGDKRQQGLPLMLHLAARGWVCVAINYRLSPRAVFPEHLIDVKLAIRWIREHVSNYGGDPAFLAVTGGSAGGHLTALTGLTAGDPEYQPGFEQVDTAVQACVPFYGVYDFTDRLGLHVVPFVERVVMKRRLADDREAFERASPMSRVRPDAPPFFVLHGSHDSLVPVATARHFVELLRKTSRAPVAYAEIPFAQHAFELFHSLRTRHAVDAVSCFLDCSYEQWRRQRTGPIDCVSDAAAAG